MDIESDDSTWEDLFGSTTDLGASIFKHYEDLKNSPNPNPNNTSNITIKPINRDDSLSRRLAKTQLKQQVQQVQQQQQQSNEENALLSATVTNTTSITETATAIETSRTLSSFSSITSTTSTTPTPSINVTATPDRNHNFKMLSPNVQRILLKTSDSVDDLKLEKINSKPKFERNHLTRSHNSNLKHMKAHNTNFPLSKNLTKFTQSQSEEGIDQLGGDSSTMEATSDNNNSSSVKSLSSIGRTNLRKISSPAMMCGGPKIVKDESGIQLVNNNNDIPEDDEKTPTNNLNNNFPYTPSSRPTPLMISTGKETSVKEIIQQLNSPKTPVENEPETPVEMRVENSSSSESGNVEKNKELEEYENLYRKLSQNNRRSILMGNRTMGKMKLQQTDSSDDNYTVECINEHVKLPVGYDNTKMNYLKTIGDTLKLSMSPMMNVSSKANSKSSPILAQQNNNKLNIMSANGNDNSNLSPVLSSKASSKTSINTINSDGSLGLSNNRRLSNISICSVSSSSSSGSDNSNLNNGKLGTSYLASIESLADHSEGELMNHSKHINLTMCERAVLEIVESERNYMEDIGQVINGYLNDWRDNGCLKVDELKRLFSNIQDIYNFNTTLLKRLNEAGSDPMKIAKCFIDLRDNFEVYTTYCTSYPESISMLTKLLQSTHTNALLSSTQRMLNHTLPLGSYLLKPVQRILKYHLLLDNLRKHSSLPEIAEAHEIMEKVASHIDLVKRKLEQQSRVKELSGILDGWLGPDLSVLGELRQEGEVLENNKSRVLILFQSMLIITKPKEDKRLQLKTFISCKNLMLVEHFAGEPKMFQVVPYSDPKGQIKFTAKSVSQKRVWANQIKKAMLEHFNIPKRAQELVYKLGDEEDRTCDKNSSRKNSNSSTPDYLERRHQFRRSEMRVRNKKTRKNSTASLIFDNFTSSQNKEIKKVESPTFVSYSSDLTKNLKLCKCDNDCNCKEVKTQLNDTFVQQQKQKLEQEHLEQQALSNEQLQKSRSKSEPRLPDNFSSNMETIKDKQKAFEAKSMSKTADDLYKYSSLGRPKSKSVDIKMYNTKTLPKRISTLKKNKVKKETCKFYTDLPADNDNVDTTVLKITESTDDLFEKCKIKRSTEVLKPRDNLKQQSALTQELKQKQSQQQPPPTANHLRSAETNPADEIPNDVNEDDDDYNKIEKCKNLIKKDAEIISQLIMESNKDFNKLLNKPPKKKSIDYTVDKVNPSSPASPKSLEMNREEAKDDCNELEYEDLLTSRSTQILNRLNEIQNTIRTPEPIYESLLRNVHVPYKFAPALNRSVSQPNPHNTFSTEGGNKKAEKEKESLKHQRPESDYVTLTYTEEGSLVAVEDEQIYAEISQLHHTSDSHINYNQKDAADKVDSEELDKNSIDNTIDTKSEILKTGTSTVNVFERKGSFNLKASPRALLQRFMSVRTNEIENVFKSRPRKSLDNQLNGGADANAELIPTDAQRYGVIYKQGSEDLGSRIAHVDYCDPKTLFSNNAMSNSNIFINTQSMKSQRDSVFSLTSSNDSINDAKVTTTTPTANSMDASYCSESMSNGGSMAAEGDSYYEKDVEESLENDFRDSAVYSDDNDKKLEFFDAQTSCTEVTYRREPPKVPKKPSLQPPPVPAKPAKLSWDAQQRQSQSDEQASDGVDSSSGRDSKESKTSSWVLKQIRKFE